MAELFEEATDAHAQPASASDTIEPVSQDIYLVGKMRHAISTMKLPSNRDIFSVLFYNTRITKLNAKESASLVVEEVLSYWKKARIPIKDPARCRLAVEKLYDEWKKLAKSAKRTTETQKRAEMQFCDKLDDLFDVSSQSAVQAMKESPFKAFFLQQKEKGQPGFMIGIPEEMLKKEERRLKRKADAHIRQTKYEQQKHANGTIE